MLFRLVTKWQFWAVVAVLLIPVASVQADPVISGGCAYSYVGGPNTAYPDGTGKMLTDGVSDYSLAWAANSVGYLAPANSPNIVFDLGQAYDVSLVQVVYSVWDTAGMSGFDGATVRFSNNADMSNPIYTRVRGLTDLTAAGWITGTETGDDNMGYAGNLWVDDPVQPAAARYVELTMTPHTYAKYGNVGWGMISEVLITGTAAATPEPSSCILVLTGLIGLLAYAWRKRK